MTASTTAPSTGAAAGRVCTKCGLWKPYVEICKDKRGKNGMASRCKACNRVSTLAHYHRTNTPERRATLNARGRERYKSNRNAVRRAAYKYEYGITVERYEEMLVLQGGGCAICGRTCTTGHRLGVDHNHKTAQVRGLLCKRCNLVLGNIGDDVGILRRAISYLETRR